MEILNTLILAPFSFVLKFAVLVGWKLLWLEARKSHGVFWSVQIFAFCVVQCVPFLDFYQNDLTFLCLNSIFPIRCYGRDIKLIFIFVIQNYNEFRSPLNLKSNPKFIFQFNPIFFRFYNLSCFTSIKHKLSRLLDLN